MASYWPKVPAGEESKLLDALGGAGDYTVQPGDFFVTLDATEQHVDLFLPLAAESQGRLLLVVVHNAAGAQGATFFANVADATPLVNGSATYVVPVADGDKIHYLECDGAVWRAGPIQTANLTVTLGWLFEQLSIADLSDVSGVTGSGDVVAMQLAPQVVNPRIDNAVIRTAPGFLNAQHDHSDAANAGQMVGATALSDATATPAASKIPIADGGGKLAAGWLQEVLALADMTDVTAKTGTGTVVVMDTSPAIVMPTIASMVNANHNHQDAAGGATLDHGAALTGLGDDDHVQYAAVAGRSVGQTIIGALFGGIGPPSLTLKGVASGGGGWISLVDPILLTDQAADPTSGLLQRNGALIKWHDGTAVRKLISDLDATATPTASKIPIADGSNKLAAGWLSEVLALADLSDVTAKTGTGTVAVMQGSPNLMTPTIADLTNATHTHQAAASGGLLQGLAQLMDTSGRCVRSTLPNINTGMILVSNTAYFVYLGRVTVTSTFAFVRFAVRTAGAGAQTAEVGFFSTPTAPSRANQTVTKLAATGTVDDLTGTGVKGNTNTLAISVAAGTHLWAGIRTAMATTQPSPYALIADRGHGRILSTAASGALTGAGPWTGALITDAGTTLCPDLEGALD